MKTTITLEVNEDISMIDFQRALEPFFKMDGMANFVVMPTWDIDRDTIELVIYQPNGREK